MNTILGLLIIAVGSFGQSSSYVPIKKIKDWSWECFWLVQGIFAWLLFPYLGALLAVPDGHSLFGVIASAGASNILKTIGFGVLWGVGGLTFGLSMRYLGIALGQSISLGTCSAFGTQNMFCFRNAYSASYSATFPRSRKNYAGSDHRCQYCYCRYCCHWLCRSPQSAEYDRRGKKKSR